jgi:deoxyhypusine synthase
MEKMANEKIFGLNLKDIYRYKNVVEKQEKYEYKEIETVQYKQQMSFESTYYEFIRAIGYRLTTSYFRD